MLRRHPAPRLSWGASLVGRLVLLKRLETGPIHAPHSRAVLMGTLDGHSGPSPARGQLLGVQRNFPEDLSPLAIWAAVACSRICRQHYAGIPRARDALRCPQIPLIEITKRPCRGADEISHQSIWHRRASPPVVDQIVRQNAELTARFLSLAHT